MESRKSKPHGMSSDKASRVKVRGHRKEFLFEDVIDGLVQKGTGKPDVISRYGQWFSVKGGSEKSGGEGRDGRIQVFLYNKENFEDPSFPGGTQIVEIFNCFPPTKAEYESNKTEVKAKISEKMKVLKDYLSIPHNLGSFLDRVFFDRQVNFFVVYHDEIFYVFAKNEVWNVFMNNLVVGNSSGDSGSQKVTLSYGSYFAEIEMRTSEGKYPSMFMPMNKKVMMKLLTDKITQKKELKHNLWLYGEAIKSYKYDKKKL